MRRANSELTRRESQVIVLIAEGLTNVEIGDRLGISDRTVAKYVFEIFKKTGSRNRVEATLYALRSELASLDVG